MTAAALRAVALTALMLGLAACSLPYIPGVTSPPPAAAATLRDSSGRVVGTALFLQESHGVRVLLDVKELANGDHAVHIHEMGRCEPPAFESAGAHFNPKKTEHGTSNPKGPHAGDLPNITVDATGQGHLEYTNKLVTIEAGENSLFGGNGTSLVLHEGPDDMRTNPAGNSGARIACGVITRGG